MDYDFIEIGTSDFQTCIQSCKDHEVGLSIEPLKLYLDRLPNKPNVTKVNCAISLDGTNGTVPIYWVHPDDIAKHGMTHWLKGCNSIGKPHLQHNEAQTKGHMELVRCDDVDSISMSELFSRYDVDKIKFLKIDTEGGDCAILQSMIPALEKRDKELWPKRITFEANILTSENTILDTVGLYQNLGYKMVNRTRTDIALELKGDDE